MSTGAPSVAPNPSSRSTSLAPTYQPIQYEGNALFDMAAAMPGLKSISGKHIVTI